MPSLSAFYADKPVCFFVQKKVDTGLAFWEIALTHGITIVTTMRTKTLLLAAVISATGAATSLAQVYSVNAVGYINLDIPQGFSIIANQLNATPDNSIATVLPSAPDGTLAYKFDPTSGGFLIGNFDSFFGGWSGDPISLNPGDGVFISSPSAWTQTLVGEVPQGNLTTTLSSPFALVSSQVPQQGGVSSALGYPETDGAILYFYTQDSNSDGIFDGYDISSFDAFLGWQPAEPVVDVGQGFWSATQTAGTWTRNFSVNN